MSQLTLKLTLSGEPGSGKTTALNLIKEALEERFNCIVDATRDDREVSYIAILILKDKQ